ncbi:hypothetical protein [Scytonema sp. NUACC26]|uniref:hypothetical protein n=1 Tax=Scytonema sp. NUACC26 TaxID=3140176 RepID=UPI0034DB9781
MEINWQRLNLDNIPAVSGIYAFKYSERWLYIGKANNLLKRLGTQHLPLQFACKHFPDTEFLYCLSDSPLRLERQLHKELSPEWNGGTSFETVLWEQMYAATGLHCQSGYNFQTIKDEQAFWQNLAIYHPERFEAYSSRHLEVLAQAIRGQYHTGNNLESTQLHAKAAINSL